MNRKLFTATLFFVCTAVAALAAVALMPGSASAYEFWDTAGTDDCAQCHTTAGGFGTFGSLHGLHTAMVSDCDTCHPSGAGSTPVTTNVSGPITGGNGVSCIGCHTGPGLREHHRNVSPAAATCGGCHTNPESPAPESTLPPYYGTADVIGVDDPCNPTAAAMTNENWDGDFMGLDNDGDTLYDGNDPDCQAAPAGATYNLKTGVLTSPETQVGSKAYNVGLTRQAVPGFFLDLTSASKVTPTGSPTCTYNGGSGVLDCPVINVGNRSYHGIFDKLSGGFQFELRSATRN